VSTIGLMIASGNRRENPFREGTSRSAMKRTRFPSSCFLCAAVLVLLPTSPCRQSTASQLANGSRQSTALAFPEAQRQAAPSPFADGFRPGIVSQAADSSRQSAGSPLAEDLLDFKGAKLELRHKTCLLGWAFAPEERLRGRPATCSAAPKNSLASTILATEMSKPVNEITLEAVWNLFAPQTQPTLPSQRPKAALLDFAWLAGKWQGSWGPRVAEQIWTAPKGGQMLGLFRAVENDKIIVIELFSLLETPEGVELRFRHFTPALMPWEQSGLPTLKLTAFDAKTAVFENAGDGQPKRNVFTRIDPDTYTSKSDIVPAAGSTHVIEIRYHRQK